MNLNEAFANVLRELRTERGISQTELAERAGLGRAYVSGLERGLHSPTLETLCRCAEAFGLPATEFVNRIESRQRTPRRRARARAEKAFTSF
jgi:transcriptional regulator with XRE-family HTH domain